MDAMEKSELEIAMEVIHAPQRIESKMNLNFKYYKIQLLVPIILTLGALVSFLLEKLWNSGFAYGLGSSAIIISLLGIYDRWFWKYPVFSLLNYLPNLNGKYTGTICYERCGRQETKNVEITIKQTCSNIKVKCLFKKVGERDTRSESRYAYFTNDKLGDQELHFLYHNEGSQMNGDTLSPHDGINILRIEKTEEGYVLDGHYFTNRDPQTKGLIKVSQIKQNSWRKK